MEEGIWLGHARSSNEAVIGTSEGVVRAYDVKGMLGDQKWDKEAVKKHEGHAREAKPESGWNPYSNKHPCGRR